MNKLIKQLLENLFDDYDDIIQNDSDDIRTALIGKMLKYDTEEAKNGFLIIFQLLVMRTKSLVILIDTLQLQLTIIMI